MANLQQGYRNAAQQLNVPGWDQTDVHIPQLLQSYLSKDDAGRWILVFDNADDIEMWYPPEQQSGRLIDCLPRSKQGFVLSTTRDRKVALRLAEHNISTLEPLDDESAFTLMESYLEKKGLFTNDPENAKALFTQLTHLPLALAQAAAYINESGIGIADYMALLGEQEEDVIEVLNGRKRVLGTENIYTYQGMGSLAGAYRILGRLEEAEELLVQVVEWCERVLGKWNGNTSWSMSRLAEVYRDQGRMKEAEEVFVQLVEGNKRTYGNEHRWTLVAMANLAGVYRDQGRVKEAEEMWVQLAEVDKSTHGKERQWTLGAMNHLAGIYWDQGRMKEAEEVLMQLVEGNKRTYGKEHQWRLWAMAGLALVYRDQGLVQEAEDLEAEIEAVKRRLEVEDEKSEDEEMEDEESDDEEMEDEVPEDEGPENLGPEAHIETTKRGPDVEDASDNPRGTKRLRR
ncbi:TPR-like protein [Trichodelitschia bisporula]|uniref:TPR-like protein n=1 Tax=Trichodelitschia bisporula TaxID=703511 RepID=A0A6G1HMJ2_9PEZI|nr:TPR-like protein [Trichodelitschia bisporula]